MLNVYENIVLPVELDGDIVDQKFIKSIAILCCDRFGFRFCLYSRLLKTRSSMDCLKRNAAENSRYPVYGI